MSDKSFGDHQNRNIVKNPLLSTAVTGLSLEDLTHNAVLLPVVPSQGVIPSQDNISGGQTQTLRNPGQNTHNLSSGDSYTSQKQSINIFQSPTLHLDTKTTEINRNEQSVTLSKASKKPDDDFDVNEYFARLQGTRYVSAPLNSHVKDETNQTLEATEENLEEINLNETDKSIEEVQHSLTADIAQNFSQLPTVLPQVASAVFSSFSNMLSMKSREQTPDERIVKEPNPEVIRHLQSESINVPLMGVDNYAAPREMALPPKEPPLIGGTGNFRITTKKKTYAQIPGLSSRDAASVPSYNIPPASHTAPPYFTPSNDYTDNSATNQEIDIRPPNKLNTQQHHFTDVTQPYSFYNPNSYNSNVTQAVTDPIASITAPIDDGNFFKPITEDRNDPSPGVLRQSIDFNAPQEPSAPIIPPPPMFSNLPQRESQTSVGKSILPPSVARRLTSKQPIMTPNPLPGFTQNYFIPGAESEIITGQSHKTDALEASNNLTNVPQIGFHASNAQDALSTVRLNEKATLGLQNEQQINKSNLQLSEQFGGAPFNTDIGFASPSIQTSTACQNIGALRNNDTPSAFSSNTSNLTPPTFFNPNSFQTTATLGSLSNPNESTVTAADTILVSTQQSYEIFSQIPAIPNTIAESSFVSTGTMPNIAPGFNLPPVLPPSNFMPIQSSIPPPMTYVNPIAQQMMPQTEAIPNVEPPKSLPLPPKNVGNQSYRLSKKRPKYYAGPIEGISAISNNVKPVLPMLDNTSYPGPLFSPNEATSSTSHLASEAVAPNPAPFDICKPAEIAPPYGDSLLNEPYEQYPHSDYSTSFDLSRQTTDSYEDSKEDQPIGFGLLGSLKSKLSAIDINKLQDKVTTFFDPTYNNTTSGIETQDNYSYQSLPLEPPNFDVAHGQTTNFNVYVPDNQQTNQIYPRGNLTDPHINYNPNTYVQNQMYQNSGHIENTQQEIGFSHPESKPNIETSTNFQQTISRGDNLFDSNHTQNILSEVYTNKSESTTYTPEPLTNRYYDPTINPPLTNLGSISKPGHFIPPNIEPAIPIPKQASLPPSSSFFDKNISHIETSPPMYKSERTLHDYSNLNITQESISVDHYVTDKSLGDPKRNPDTANSAYNPFASASFFDDVNKNADIEVQEETTIPLNQDESPVKALSKTLFELSTTIADKDVHNENLKEASEVFTEPIPHLDGCYFAKDRTLSKTNSDLNICATCREVSKLEGKDSKEVEDLTSQLIENITSPIQLSNPVGIPLTEPDMPVDINVRSDINLLAEITNMTEETMETIQVQSAVELLDDANPCITTQLQYGWTSNTDSIATNILRDNSYGVDVDSNSVELFGRSLFSDAPTKASNKVRDDFKLTSDDVPSIMCATIASAPELDDDAKSDETGGLDVHSIEQDAKKDFPEFDTEEFLIEPSEKDDDNIESPDRRRESSVDVVEEIDSFTNRVERFKKMEEHNMEANENTTDTRRNSQMFDLPVATSPALTIASYFDTGNYAVETHYRNSISSPSNLSSFSVGSPHGPMRIPPGFEEEFKRRLSGLSSTESFTPFLTRTEPNPVVVESSDKVDDKHTLSLDKPLESQSIIKPPIFPMEPKEEETPMLKDIFKFMGDDIEIPDDLVKLSDFPETFGVEPEIRKPVQESVLTEPIKTVVTETLQDPINFFGSTASEEQPEESTNINFNRLASYFSSPPKTEPSKPFFELSQSQDHYRHGSLSATAISDNFSDSKIINDKIHKDHSKTIHDIPQEQYLANLRLMEDLTSYQNIEITNPDQIVRSVNYFTVEYRCNLNSNVLVNLDNNLNKTEIQTQTSNITRDKEPEKNETSNESILRECQYCCDLSVGPITDLNRIDFDKIPPQDLKFKKSMDQESESANKDGANMNVEKSVAKPVTINMNEVSAESEDNEGVAILNENRVSSEYSPVKYHWFYRVDFEGKSTWKGFSVSDSRALEDALHSPDLNENTTVATDGGRYDVNVMGRLRMPVYWNDKPTNVRRCSWFVKGTTSARYVPYTESSAEKLEEEYRQGMTTGVWHRRLLLPNNECVVMHGPTVMAHLVNAPQSDAFTQPPMLFFSKKVYRNLPKLKVARDYLEKVDHLLLMVHGAGEFRKQMDKMQSIMRPRPVHRGWAESEIEDLEPSNIDHLLLLCHGVGSACDMRFRSVEEVVDDFRATSHQLLQAHYKNSYDNGVVGRIEVLPISWHKTLHTGDKGVDQRLAHITLDSIPKLRHFTNDTVLDVLFYTSPVYCQTIIDTVCSELNRIYTLFKARNPSFTGGVSLGGHSLGSVILYDLLCHQPQVAPEEAANKLHINGTSTPGYPNVVYPVLKFQPDSMYAMGSPISIFECIRGVEHLGMDFSLPTCRNFFNIFHPYDPIAYRIEPMINAALKDIKPSLIPHHKGRKRMHLELKDTMARVGADIKQKLIESIKSTWATVWKSQPPPSDSTLEKVVEEELEKGELADEPPKEKSAPSPNVQVTPEMLGRLNHGRRIDYVLQEAPFELINEYIFAMSSHVCYWESEDTMLLILREIYEALGIRPDSTVPQQTMIVERTKIQDDSIGRSEQSPSTSRGT